MDRSRDALLTDLRADAPDGPAGVPALLAEAAETVAGDAELAYAAVALGYLWTSWLCLDYDDQADAALADCIDGWRRALDRLDQSDPAGQPARILLAMACLTRYVGGGRIDDLDASLALIREILSVTDSADLARPALVSDLVSLLRMRYTHTSELADLDTAVRAGKEVLAAAEGHPWYPVLLTHLGATQLTRFEHAGMVTDLHEAIANLDTALSVVPDDPTLLTVLLANLAVALRERYQRGGDTADIDRAVELARQACREAPPDYPGRAELAVDVAAVLVVHAERTGLRDDIDEAVTAARQAEAASPAGHALRAGALNNLVVALRLSFLHTHEPETLDQAVQAARDAVAATTPDRPSFPLVNTALAMALVLRFGHGQKDADIAEAVKAAQAAATHALRLNPDRPLILSNLALMQFAQAVHQQTAGFENAVRTIREAVRDVTVTDPRRSQVLFLGSMIFQARALSRSSRDDLDESERLARDAVAATPCGPLRPDLLARLGEILYLRFTSVRDAELGPAIDATSQAMAEAAADHPRRDQITAQLASLRRLDEEQRAGADITPLLATPTAGHLLDMVIGWPGDRGPGYSAAVARLRQELAGVSRTDPRWAELAEKLCAALCLLAAHTRRPADVEEAVEYGRKAVAATPAGTREWVVRLGNLASALGSLYEYSNLVEHLNEAIELFGKGLSEPATVGVDRTWLLIGLGGGLITRFELAGQPDDARGAVDCTHEAATDIQPGHALFTKSRVQLSNALLLHHTVTGDLGSLEKAVKAARDAFDIDRAAASDARSWMALSEAVRARYMCTEAPSDLDEAVDAARHAVHHCANRDVNRAVYLARLGVMLRERFDLTGKVADVDEAIEHTKTALAAAAPNDPRRAQRLSHLSIAYYGRYQRLRQQPDLVEALKHNRAATGLRPGQPTFGDAINLATILTDMFEHTEHPDYLTDAVDAARLVVETAPDNEPAARVVAGGTLSRVLMLRAQYPQFRIGAAADLAEAVTAAYRVVEALTPDDPAYAKARACLGVARFHRYQAITHQLEGLNAAIDDLRAGTDDITADAEEQARSLTNLALALAERERLRRSRVDAVEAHEVWRRAAEVRSARVGTRAWAAVNSAGWAAVLRDADSALDGFSRVVKLLPVLAWPGLDRSTQESNLRPWSHVTNHAAAWAIRAKKPEYAVELLEQGRSVLWAQALRTRTDMDALRAAAPELAARLDDLRHQIDAADRDVGAPGAGSPRLDALGEQDVVRRRLADNWERVLEKVRRLPGFEAFLAPARFEDLRAAAAEGPVVLINVSLYGCDALIVRADGVEPVSLPGLSSETAAGYACAMADAARSGPASLRPVLAEVLGWLRKTVVGPVLAVLGHEAPLPDGADGRRVWWCPTGPLTVLPLHAAAMDHVVSSYTTTLTALLHSRARPQPSGAARLLAIGMPETPGMSSLKSVPKELDWIHASVPITTRMEHPSATRGLVLDAMARHNWVHIAAHAGVVPNQPTNPAIVLSDGLLRVTQIAARQLPAAELIYLSACATLIGDGDLADESIHLAAACQFAGYRHVVATLWPIKDRFAAEAADALYRRLRDGVSAGGPDLASTAKALHHTVRQMRARYPDQPEVWAPYAHLGP